MEVGSKFSSVISVPDNSELATESTFLLLLFLLFKNSSLLFLDEKLLYSLFTFFDFPSRLSISCGFFSDKNSLVSLGSCFTTYFSKSLPYLQKVYKMKPEETSIVQGIAAVYYSLNDMEKHVEYMNILKGLESKNSGDN